MGACTDWIAVRVASEAGIRYGTESVMMGKLSRTDEGMGRLIIHFSLTRLGCSVSFYLFITLALILMA
jgi:hypothetical protein